LVASYGNGSDALWFKVNRDLEQDDDRLGVKGLLASKCLIPDYISYLNWRGLVAGKEKRMPFSVTYAAAPAIYREQDKILSLVGSKCKVCGAIEYPPQRICGKCQAKDEFEAVSLSDKKGKIFSSSMDPITRQLVGMVNLEGGGRILCNLVDGNVSDFKIDSPVEMSFRHLELLPNDSIYSYVWKATPLRAQD